MDASTICVTFIVTIFGIAFPILFQVVTRLDEKYSSILIIDQFKSEREWKFFQISLIASLISILIWIFRLSTPSIEIKWMAFLIENSAILLLIIATVFLIVSFFSFVYKINIYYAPSKFIKYLIDQTKSDTQNLESPYFKSIGDILYFSIKEQNETISRTIADYLYSAFQQYRDSKANVPIEYPFSYYELVYKSTQELAILNDKKLEFLITRSVGGIWFLGELRDYQISEKTYSWLWRNLLIAIKYERDDMVLSYWENAHQYYSINLQYISPHYSGIERTITNKEEVEKRKIARSRFLEFHYALGGLLLYRQRYNCIKRIFKFTTNIPPKYELLPETMDEIFRLYFQFRDPYEIKYSWISHQYSFPDLEGLQADGTIKHWISQYMALLFLRQYSIVPYLIYMKPLEPPTLPKSQNERKQWMDYLDYFQRLIENSYNNQELRLKTGLEFLTDKWCQDNNHPNPLALITGIKMSVAKEFETTQVKQDISEAKRLQFQTSTKTILTKTFQKYSVINNPDIFESNYNNWYVHGDRAILDKSAFAEDQESHHTNFDTFLSENLSDNFGKGISETFYNTRSKSYLLKPENLFPAIDRLKINDKDYILVCFGINILYYKEYFKINELEENKYRNLELINFSNYNHYLVDESIFILKKSDLPHIEFKLMEADQIEKYSLVPIDNHYNIYTSIIDLNLNDNLREELKKSPTSEDLLKSVLVCTSFKAEIRWKKSISNILLRTSSIFSDRGLPNDLKDVEEIK